MREKYLSTRNDTVVINFRNKQYAKDLTEGNPFSIFMNIATTDILTHPQMESLRRLATLTAVDFVTVIATIVVQITNERCWNAVSVVALELAITSTNTL